MSDEIVTTEAGDELLVCAGCGSTLPVLVDGRCGPCNAKGEWFYALRRSDGEDIGDYSFVSASKENPWKDLDDYDEDEDAYELELVRMDVTVVETKTVGGPKEVCDEWKGLEQHAGTRWEVIIPQGRDDSTWPGRPVELNAFDTAAEADSAVATLPDVFYMHCYGMKTERIERSSLVVIPKERLAFVTNCSRCHHPKAAHRA